MKSVAAILVAAGRGSRFGGELPKQYTMLEGRMILSRTLAAFLVHPKISHITVVIHPDDAALYQQAVAELASAKLGRAVTGGATRQASVLAGLKAVPEDTSIVLIHDAARPFVTSDLISRSIAAAKDHGAAVPATAVTDSLVLTKDGTRSSAIDRDQIRAVQTPQAFGYRLILEAHEKAAHSGTQNLTDDASVAAAAGHAVHLIQGDPANLKITTRDDMMMAAERLRSTSPLISRTAQGFDVHAFGEGDHVWLCGLKIPHAHGFIAHSDGDVALHAITDALLGAMADGDIGQHFPPSDPQWKGAASDQFLAYAAGRLRERGGVIDLLDVTIICEAPKISPHTEAMRARVAAIAGVSIGNVSVKATTTEKLGFTGRKEGISALASATIRLPLQIA